MATPLSLCADVAQAASLFSKTLKQPDRLCYGF